MSGERLDPHAFAQKLNEWARGTMIGAPASLPRARAERVRSSASSPNLVGNAGQGTLTAEAEIIHRGRTTLVAEV